MKRLATLMVMAACSAAPNLPPDATSSITVSTGGFFGQSGTRIFGDDRVVTTGSDLGRATRPLEQTIPGAYARAAGVIRATGRQARAQVKPDALSCTDYGSDTVRAAPPIAGFDGVTSGCPVEAVSTLVADILAAIAQPQ